LRKRELQASHDAVHVRQRNFIAGLAAMNRYVADGDLQAEGSGMETANFGAPASDPLHFGH
jgi:hypothetical protein